jgi:hypothetical protein
MLHSARQGVITLASADELPRRKQRGITKNFDYELRKRRGTFGPSELSKALDRCLFPVMIKPQWAFDSPIKKNAGVMNAPA